MSCSSSCSTFILIMLPLDFSIDSFMTCSVSIVSIEAYCSLNSTIFVSTLNDKSTNSCYHGWVTFINSILSACSRYSCIYNFFLFPVCTILCTSVRPAGSSVNFAIFASVCHISSCTSLTTSIYLMPDHDSVVVSSRCVVSLTQNAFSLAISLVAAFNCTVGSCFSNFSIRALYSISTASILSAIAFARTTTFHTFSSIGSSSSTCMSGSSEHNSVMVFFMLTSSFYHCTAVAVTFW